MSPRVPKRRPKEGAKPRKSSEAIEKPEVSKRASTKSKSNFSEDDGAPSLPNRSGWLHASLDGSSYPVATPRGGKWLFFIARKYVDDTWTNVKKALRSGSLGSHIKVSTASADLAQSKVPHVLCVHTYDSDDVADVMRIRDVLRSMGFKRPVSYKTDEASLGGEYRVLGHTDIAKYHA